MKGIPFDIQQLLVLLQNHKELVGASDVTDGLNLSEDVMSSNSQLIDQPQDMNLLDNTAFNGYLTKAIASTQHLNLLNYMIG
uniref:Uncharacterized protein n=1 Tax=Amphimedon queenslandica TaxID=400682 RepID=A0A1X7UX60_AMPQE